MHASLSFALVLGVSASVVACGDECRLDRDCASGQLCSAEGLCRNLPFVETPHQDLTDGYDDAPGSGRVFVMDSISFAREGVGFDLDDVCRAEGECVDNMFATFGEIMNDQVRQGLLGGETLFLVEIAGIDPPFRGNDENVTLKFYHAVDADNPFFPANNFQIPQDQTKCCEFLVRPSSLDHTGVQAQYRLRARIEDGRIRSVAPGRVNLPILPSVGTSSNTNAQLELRRTEVAVSLMNNFTRLGDGLLGGVVPAASLFAPPTPYCETTNLLCPRPGAPSSWLELLTTFVGAPDIDLDGDGLERFETDRGKIVACRDGCDGCARPPIINPVDVNRPDSCVLSSRVADGFSIAVGFTATPASIVGVGDFPAQTSK